MKLWRVAIVNSPGGFAGTIVPKLYTVRAVSSGEAKERACRQFVESQFEVSAIPVEDPK